MSLNLLEQHNFSGKWGLSAGDLTTAGELIYDKDTIRLRLEGHVGDADFSHVFGNSGISYPVIYGRSQGKPVSLLYPLLAGTSVDQEMNYRQTYISQKSVLIRGAFVDPTQKYQSIAFHLKGLAFWLTNGQPFNFTGRSGEKAYLHFERSDIPHSHRVEAISSNVELKILRFEGESTGDSSTLRADGWVILKPEAKQELDWFIRELGVVCAFFELFFGCAVCPDQIIVDLENQGEEDNSAEVLISLVGQSQCTYKIRHEYFLQHEAVAETLSAYLNAWFCIFDKIEMPAYLLRSLLSSDGLRNHLITLSLFHILEGIHRSFHPGEYTDQYEDVRLKLSQAIPSDLDKSHKEALKSRIRYGNQYSLRKRMDELVQGVNAEIVSIIFGSNKFPGSYIDTRNYYTHWDDELRQLALDGFELYYANKRLLAFAFAVLLTRVGIPSDLIKDAMEGHSDIARNLRT